MSLRVLALTFGGPETASTFYRVAQYADILRGEHGIELTLHRADELAGAPDLRGFDRILLQKKLLGARARHAVFSAGRRCSTISTTPFGSRIGGCIRGSRAGARITAWARSRGGPVAALFQMTIWRRACAGIRRTFRFCRWRWMNRSGRAVRKRIHIRFVSAGPGHRATCITWRRLSRRWNRSCRIFPMPGWSSSPARVRNSGASIANTCRTKPGANRPPSGALMSAFCRCRTIHSRRASRPSRRCSTWRPVSRRSPTPWREPRRSFAKAARCSRTSRPTGKNICASWSIPPGNDPGSASRLGAQFEAHHTLCGTARLLAQHLSEPAAA